MVDDDLFESDSFAACLKRLKNTSALGYWTISSWWGPGNTVAMPSKTPKCCGATPPKITKISPYPRTWFFSANQKDASAPAPRESVCENLIPSSSPSRKKTPAELVSAFALIFTDQLIRGRDRVFDKRKLKMAIQY